MLTKKVLNLGYRHIAKRYSTATSPVLTSLYDFHVENGGKMVNFGGFMLPVQYADLSITNSHLFTRKHASLFDVSHMLQTEVTGVDCISCLESIVTANLKDLPENTGVLTVFPDENGGILDDLIITKVSDRHLYIVSNAGRKEHDKQHMFKAVENFRKINKESDLKITFYEPSDKALLALQGPKSAGVLQKLTPVDLSKLYFMNSIVGNVAGIKDCRITRCGYTGEDGFEISIPSQNSVSVANELLSQADVKLAGLGARDSLRLEAGMCLYGNDITTKTTPIEATLTWLIDKKRRLERNFPGAERILQQIKDGSRIKRVGLMLESGPPARHDTSILDSEGNEIGQVTSGCPSPSLGKNIAMGYVPTATSKAGTEVSLKIRGKLYKAVVSKMPFVKAQYYSKPK